MNVEKFPVLKYGDEDLHEKKRISRFLVKNDIEFSPSNFTKKEYEAHILVRNVTPGAYKHLPRYYSPPKTSHINYMYHDKVPDYIKEIIAPTKTKRTKSTHPGDRAKNKFKLHNRNGKHVSPDRSSSKDKEQRDVNFGKDKDAERRLLHDIAHAYDSKGKLLMQNSQDSFLYNGQHGSQNDLGVETPRLGNRGGAGGAGVNARKSVLDDLPVVPNPAARMSMLADIKGFNKKDLKHTHTHDPTKNRLSMMVALDSLKPHKSKEERRAEKKAKNARRAELGLPPEPESDSDDDNLYTNTSTPIKDKNLTPEQKARIIEKRNKAQAKKIAKQLKKEKKERERKARKQRNAQRAAQGLPPETDTESESSDSSSDSESSEEEVEIDEVDNNGKKTGKKVWVWKKKPKSKKKKSKGKKKGKSGKKGHKNESSSESESDYSESSSESEYETDPEDMDDPNDTPAVRAAKKKRREAKRKAKEERHRQKEMRRLQREKKRHHKKKRDERDDMYDELKGVLFGGKKKKIKRDDYNPAKKRKKNGKDSEYDDLAATILRHKKHRKGGDSDSDDSYSPKRPQDLTPSKYKTPYRDRSHSVKPGDSRKRAEEYYDNFVKKTRKTSPQSKSPFKWQDKYSPAPQKHRNQSSQSKRKKDTSPKVSPSPDRHKYSDVHGKHKDMTYIPIGQQKHTHKLTTKEKLDQFQKFYDDKMEQLNNKFTDKVQDTFKDILGDEDMHDRDPHSNRNFIFKYGPWELDRLKIALRRNVEGNYNEQSRHILNGAKQHEQKMEAYLFKDKPYFNEQINYDDLGLSSPQKVLYHKIVAERTKLRTTDKLRRWYEGDKSFKI